MKNEQAFKAYNQKLAAIKVLQKEVNKALKNHELSNKLNADWSSVGSITYVHEKLTQIRDFIK